MATKKQEVAPQIELTPEEIQAVMQARENVGGVTNVAISDLAAALTQALNAAKPPEKKTPFTRKKGGPWEPKNGQVKPKLKRKMYQHGIELKEGILSVEEVELLNKVKAGHYCGGHIRVIKRKDRGLDIDYPIKTASQRLKLVNQFGITDMVSLLKRLIAEADKPELYRPDDEDDD